MEDFGHVTGVDATGGPLSAAAEDSVEYFVLMVPPRREQHNKQQQQQERPAHNDGGDGDDDDGTSKDDKDDEARNKAVKDGLDRVLAAAEALQKGLGLSLDDDEEEGEEEEKDDDRVKEAEKAPEKEEEEGMGDKEGGMKKENGKRMIKKKKKSGRLDYYVWQREEFRLEYRRVEGILMLYGKTNYGDSIEDEWVIVYLLRELSRQFRDLWIKVVDTDGEFLLAEAAGALPRWLVPKVADNRIWINDGNLLVIPLASPLVDEKSFKATEAAAASAAATATARPSSSAATEPAALRRRPLSMAEAVDVIATRRESLLHLPKVQEEAFYRLRNYPGQIAANCHNALVAIPRTLACVVRAKPRLVSAAVEAFYLRDPIALRPLQSDAAVRRTPFPPVDLVTLPVRFARAGYAQLKCQHFASPAAWAKILAADAEEAKKEEGAQRQKQNETSASASASVPHGAHGSASDRLGQLEMGMRLTCGFIMLVCDPQNREKESVKYIRRLLEAMGRGDVRLPSDDDVERWRAECAPDDESWLGIDFADLERELNPAATRKEGADRTRNRSRGAREEAAGEEDDDVGTSFTDKNTHENLRKLVQRLDSFLGDETAGADGAGIFDDDNDDDDDDDEDDESQDAEDDGDVSLDEEEFARMMREMMGLPPSAAAANATATATAPAPTAPPRDPSLALPRQRIVELGADSDAGSGGEGEDDDDDDDSEADLQDIMRRMDAELRETGVLDLHPPPPPVGSAALTDGRNAQPFSASGSGGGSSSRAGKSVQMGHSPSAATTAAARNNDNDDDDDDHNDDEDEDADIRIDYALAANLLQSLGGGGGADPSSAGKLLASLGFDVRDGD